MKKLFSVLAVLFMLPSPTTNVSQKVLFHIDRNVVKVVYIWIDEDVYGNIYEGSLNFSGSIVAKDKVLSTYHGARGKPPGRFYASVSGYDRNIKLVIVKHDKASDLVLLQMERRVQWKPLKIAKKDAEWGDDILIAGYPVIQFPRIRIGKFVTQYFEAINKEYTFVTPSFYGDSGGAVLNMEGEIIGVTSWTFPFVYKNVTQYPLCSYAIPFEEVREFVTKKDLKEEG